MTAATESTTATIKASWQDRRRRPASWYVRKSLAYLVVLLGAVIMLVPSHRGSRDLTLQWMKRSMEQTIGVDMISK